MYLQRQRDVILDKNQKLRWINFPMVSFLAIGKITEMVLQVVVLFIDPYK